MKIQIKHNLIIFEREHEWEEVARRIRVDYGDKIFAISWRLKRELGFTVRRHKGLEKHQADFVDYNAGTITKLDADLENRYHYVPQVHLDFYSEPTMSWFVLKYINTQEVDI